MLLLRLLFENQLDIKIKLKISREWMEHRNGGSTDFKYAIRGFGRHLPYAVDIAVAAVLFFSVAALII